MRKTPLIVPVALGVAAGSGLGQTYTADQFAIGDLVGSRFRLMELEVSTLCEHWNGGACTTTESEFATSFRLLAYADVVDGEPTNAVALPGPETPGPGEFGGTPVIMSDADGFINFGNHPGRGCEREHFIGGITEVPGVFTVGDSGPDPRAGAWEGCWDDGEAWAGTVTRTITIQGFELLEGHPTLGDVQALRIDAADARTKDSLTTTRRAPETWDISLWIVEGYGLARIVSHEFEEGYFDWHDDGASPAYDVDTVTSQWFVRLCLADLAEPFGTVNFSDVLAFLTAFGGQDLAVDVAPPFGVLDFSDVLVFLTAFGDGCQ